MHSETVIGVISDTHGLLRREALEALQGAQRIIHAGDVGRPEILARLGDVAPVVAVRGNVDRGRWAEELPESQLVEIGRVRVYVLHDVLELDIQPAAAGIDVVISGHSHRPLVERKKGVLYLNPGSAGPRRFDLPISVARLRINGQDVKPELCELGS